MRNGRIGNFALLVFIVALVAGSSQIVRASEDVVFANRIPDASRVCLTDGTGGFACSDVDADTYDSSEVALGLIDGDPYLDVVFANVMTAVGDEQVNRVCFGDGLGALTDCSDVGPDTQLSIGVALGVINDDAHLDAVFANFGSSNRVCIGDGDGGFDCSDVSSDSNVSYAVALGFVDGDAWLDAVFGNHDQVNRVCLGDGSGAFTCSDVSTDTNRSHGLALGFVDGDSNLDLVVANGNGQANRLCLGDGNGGFSCSDLSPADPSSKSQCVALGLVDDDPHLDVVFGNNFARNRVCLGDGSGAFTCSDVSLDTKSTWDCALGFFDGEEDLDAVFANWDGVDRFCQGDGLGGFTCSDVSTDVKISNGVAVGNLDILIFADDFESGDHSNWSSVVP